MSIQNLAPDSSAAAELLNKFLSTTAGHLDADSLVATDLVAKLLGTTPGHLAQMRFEDSGPPFYKIGRKVRYSMPEVATWLAGRQFTSTAESERSA